MKTIIDAKDVLFVCVDVQEKLLVHMHAKEELVKNVNILLESAPALGVKTLVLEQYPKGLGHTSAELKLPSDVPILEKISFGAFGDKVIKQHIAKSGADILVFFGIETHVCVLQSALEAKKLGYKCALALNACSSRKACDHKSALDFLRTYGVDILPVETILFRIMGESKHPAFKIISSLVK